MARTQPHEQQNGGHDAKLVRDACDACHTRKIRCVTPQGGGPCCNCQSKDLACYFLPRYKSGRPRASTPSAEWARDSDHNLNGSVETAVEPELAQGRRRSRPTSDCSEPAWSSNKRHQQGKPSNLQSPPPPPPPPTVSTSSDRSLWGAYQPPSPSTLSPLFINGSPALFTGDLPDLFADHLFEPTPGPPVCPQPRLIEDAHIPRTPTGTPSETLATTPQPTVRRSPPHEPARQGRACEAQFVELLHHCGKLQRLIWAMSPGHLPTPTGESSVGSLESEAGPSDHMSVALENIESSCEVMLEMCDKRAISGHGVRDTTWPMDLASLSLVVTVACKVLQAFNIVLGHRSLRVTSIKGMLLHKKLDLYLTQVRVVMEQIERETQNGPFINKELSESYRCIRKRLAGLYQETHQGADQASMSPGTA